MSPVWFQPVTFGACHALLHLLLHSCLYLYCHYQIKAKNYSHKKTQNVKKPCFFPLFKSQIINHDSRSDIVGKHAMYCCGDDFSAQRYHKWLTVDQWRPAREISLECVRMNRWLHPLQGITLQREEPWTFSLSYLSDLAQSKAMNSSHVLNTSPSVCSYSMLYI